MSLQWVLALCLLALILLSLWREFEFNQRCEKVLMGILERKPDRDGKCCGDHKGLTTRGRIRHDQVGLIQ